MKHIRIWKAGLAALALAVLLTACGGGDKGAPTRSGGGQDTTPEADPFGITVQDILEANRTETLVSDRGSFLMETDYNPEMDTTGLPVILYADAGTVYLETDSSHELHTDKGSYLYMDGQFGAVLTPDPLTRSDFSFLVLDEATTSRETITAVDREGDTLTVRTVFSAEAIAEYYGEELAYTPYGEGDFEELTYTLDAKDLAVLSCDTVLRHADGTSLDMGPMRVTYGASLPENGVILREHQDAAELRTVTIVLDPDTEEETWYTVTARKGDVVFPYLPEGYYFLYKDPACTKEYDYNMEAHLEEDLILYSRAIDLSTLLEHDDHEHGEVSPAMEAP